MRLASDVNDLLRVTNRSEVMAKEVPVVTVSLSTARVATTHVITMKTVKELGLEEAKIIAMASTTRTTVLTMASGLMTSMKSFKATPDCKMVTIDIIKVAPTASGVTKLPIIIVGLMMTSTIAIEVQVVGLTVATGREASVKVLTTSALTKKRTVTITATTVGSQATKVVAVVAELAIDPTSPCLTDGAPLIKTKAIADALLKGVLTVPTTTPPTLSSRDAKIIVTSGESLLSRTWAAPREAIAASKTSTTACPVGMIPSKTLMAVTLSAAKTMTKLVHLRTLRPSTRMSARRPMTSRSSVSAKVRLQMAPRVLLKAAGMHHLMSRCLK